MSATFTSVDRDQEPGVKNQDQSAIARMEDGGTRPTLDTLEKLATAIGQELVVGVGAQLSQNRSIAKLVREGHAVVRNAG